MHRTPRRKRNAPTRFEQVDLLSGPAPVAHRQSQRHPPGEDPSQPHIKQFSDGYRVYNPLLRTYAGDRNMNPFPTLDAASERLRQVFVEVAATGEATKTVVRKAAKLQAQGADLFGGAAMARAPLMEQVGFKFNARRGAESAHLPPGAHPWTPKAQAWGSVPAGDRIVVFRRRGTVDEYVALPYEKDGLRSSTAALVREPFDTDDIRLGPGDRAYHWRPERPLVRFYVYDDEGERWVLAARDLSSGDHYVASLYPYKTASEAEALAARMNAEVLGTSPKSNAGRFAVGAKVAASYGRPPRNQPWVHPKYSGDPNDPGHGWTGEVLPVNDPRAWEGSIVMPYGRRPTAEEVDAHLAAMRAWPGKHRIDMEHEKAVPVLWEHGAVQWESDDASLFPVSGSVARKRNSGAVDAPKVTKGRDGVLRVEWTHGGHVWVAQYNARSASFTVDTKFYLDGKHVGNAINPQAANGPAMFGDEDFWLDVPAAEYDATWRAQDRFRKMVAREAVASRSRKGNPGRGHALSAGIERCVAHVGPKRVAKLGASAGLSSAIAICTAQEQRLGRVRKGTRKLTTKGKRLDRNARRRVGFAEDERAVGRLVRGARAERRGR